MQLGDGSDAALARAWQAGDVRAFDEAYRRFAPVLFGTAVGLVGDRTAAADVVHDTFLRAATRVGGLRDPARLRAWLFAILRNEAVSVHRGRSRSGGGLDDGPAPVSEWLADTAAAPDVEVSRGSWPIWSGRPQTACSTGTARCSNCICAAGWRPATWRWRWE